MRGWSGCGAAAWWRPAVQQLGLDVVLDLLAEHDVARRVAARDRLEAALAELDGRADRPMTAPQPDHREHNVAVPPGRPGLPQGALA